MRYYDDFDQKFDHHSPVQRQNRDVVRVRLVVVLFMRRDLDHVVGAVVFVLFLNVVGTDTHEDVLRFHLGHAVRSGQDVSSGDQRTAAELILVGGGAENRNRPRPGVLLRFFAADYSRLR